MTISDILSLIGIGIAIIAFLSENDREFIKNKFSKYDYLFIVIVFLYINFLVFFPWWTQNIPFLKKLEIKSFPRPTTWAYFFSIFIIFWASYKIFFAPFPKSNYNNLVNFYKKLFLKKKFTRLLYLLEKYNEKDIDKYFKLEKNELNNFIVNKILPSKQLIYETEILNAYFYSKLFTNYNNIEQILNAYLVVVLSKDNSLLNNLLKENITKNELLDSIKINYKQINYYLISKLLENREIVRNVINFTFIITKHIISYEKQFTKHLILFEKINKTNLTKILNNFVLVNYQNLVTSSFSDNKDFFNYYTLYSNYICKFETDEEIKRFLKFNIELDDKFNDDVLQIRNDAVLNTCNKKDKELIKRIYSIFKNNHLDFEGDFYINVINKIANY